MRVSSLIVVLGAGVLAALAFGRAAQADLLIKIDKSTQTMAVTVDGQKLYDWAVSTGGRGYDTPSGTYKPFRMDIDHRSEEWDDAPMPYSIFFTRTGNAVHGTYEQRYLGRAVSHGCVRLSVKNAATLWKLVKHEKMANTTVVVSGAIRDAAAPSAARSRPLSLSTDGQRESARRRVYQRHDGDQPLLPFPFFIFGR